jgi:TPR repeat protein
MRAGTIVAILISSVCGYPVNAFAQSASTISSPDDPVSDARRKAEEAYRKADYVTAMMWLRKAADRGDPRAQNGIGVFYENALGVTQDFKEAMSWYRKAADQGFAEAQGRLGNLYLLGEGVPKDVGQALIWLRKSADQGYAPSQLVLGLMYFHGEGTPQDYAQALSLLRNAADQNNNVAQYTLGVMYEKGLGVASDVDQAINWYQKAAERNENAKARLAELQQPSGPTAETTLWCDTQTINGGIVRAVVSIDTKAKYVKFEIDGQGTVEYRDGVNGKTNTSGIFAQLPQVAINVNQFVIVDGNVVKFGFRNNGQFNESSIDLRTGIYRTSGQVNQCTDATR